MWWFAESHHSEYFDGGPFETPVEAFQKAVSKHGGSFVLYHGRQQEWNFDCFHNLCDEFDCINEEIGSDDYPSFSAGFAENKSIKSIPDELSKLLIATFRDYVSRNGRLVAHCIDVSASIVITDGIMQDLLPTRPMGNPISPNTMDDEDFNGIVSGLRDAIEHAIHQNKK
jgi:hypothetical protein